MVLRKSLEEVRRHHADEMRREYRRGLRDGDLFTSLPEHWRNDLEDDDGITREDVFAWGISLLFVGGLFAFVFAAASAAFAH